ncbi:MAG: PDZ domain-containing protein [Verrucomicrobiota bacterium]
MEFSIRYCSLFTAAFVSAGLLQGEDQDKDAIIQWSAANWSPAVPTKNSSWFIGVAPKAVETATGEPVTLKSGPEDYAGKVIHFDESNGLCLIETSEPILGLPVTKFAKMPLPDAGSKLHCWKPGSSCPTTVAGKEYSVRGEPLSSPLLKVRVADVEEFCHPGTPLVCGNGKLFGILTEVVSETTGEAHAIPASCLHKLLTEFERYRRTGKVWVGLVFEDRAKTPQVVQVRSGSPAEVAGLKSGDIILSIGAHEVPDLDDLTQTIHLLTAGDPVEVKILRGLKEVTLELIPEFADDELASNFGSRYPSPTLP